MMIHPAEWSYGSIPMEFFNLSHPTLENICTHLMHFRPKSHQKQLVDQNLTKTGWWTKISPKAVGRPKSHPQTTCRFFLPGTSNIIPPDVGFIHPFFHLKNAKLLRYKAQLNQWRASWRSMTDLVASQKHAMGIPDIYRRYVVLKWGWKISLRLQCNQQTCYVHTKNPTIYGWRETSPVALPCPNVYTQLLNLPQHWPQQHFLKTLNSMNVTKGKHNKTPSLPSEAYLSMLYSKSIWLHLNSVRL